MKQVLETHSRVSFLEPSSTSVIWWLIVMILFRMYKPWVVRQTPKPLDHCSPSGVLLNHFYKHLECTLIFVKKHPAVKHFIPVCILTCLFWWNSQAIVITRSLLLLFSCKNFNVAHYSKSMKGINTKVGILAHHDKVQLQGKGHNSEGCSFGVVPYLIKKFIVENVHWQTSVGTACGALVII